MAVDLPLFPLGTVLFPHMPLALHIFEERYREMMRDCRRSGTTRRRRTAWAPWPSNATSRSSPTGDTT